MLLPVGKCPYVPSKMQSQQTKIGEEKLIISLVTPGKNSPILQSIVHMLNTLFLQYM